MGSELKLTTDADATNTKAGAKTPSSSTPETHTISANHNPNDLDKDTSHTLGQGASKNSDQTGSASWVQQSHKRGTRHLISYSRFITAVPCLGLLIASVAMTISTLISTVLVTVEAVQGHVDMQDMLVDYIEYADFFLLGIVLYIMSIGLYALFIDDDTEMPAWFEIHTLDDLKEKLIGVLGVVIGVNFLGRLIHGTDATNLALIGCSSAAVIIALSYFVKHVIAKK